MTISKEEELKKEVDQLVTNYRNKENEIKSRLFNKEQDNSLLTETNNSNTDAIAALSEKVMDLTKEINELKARLRRPEKRQ
ncbi:MAG: MbeD/MobD family mobilization/exclusion protein [Nitrososphaeraceae archaeon]